MTGELVQQYGNTVDAPDALEVCLDLFWARAVVDVADKDTSRVDVFFALAHLVAFEIGLALHLAQLLGFFLPLSGPPLTYRANVNVPGRER
jgi:hypothetical protein